MKLYKFLLYSLPIIGAISCTKVEKIEVEHIGGFNTVEDAYNHEYYVNLRQYKDSIWTPSGPYGRPVAFGWFSDWSPQGATRKGYLSSVPDSMDIISMWSGAPDKEHITDDQRKDKEFVQKVKGIKLLEVSLLSHLGKGRTPKSVYDKVYARKKAEEEAGNIWSDSKLETELKHARWDYWGFTSHNLSNKEELMAAHSKFAEALCQSLIENNWDGYDIDWEPGAGFNDADGTLANSPYQNELIIHLVKEMGKHIGPMSDPEGKGHKLLCVDGHVGIFERNCPEYIDFFIKQSYGRVDQISGPTPHKYILTENFEAEAVGGGRLLDQAAYMPQEGYKGGVGAYRFGKDYDNTPTYKWMRQAIKKNQEVFRKWKKNHLEGNNQ